MRSILVILLVIWLVLSLLGFAVQGLFWLGIVGIILFVVTAVYGFLRGRIDKS